MSTEKNILDDMNLDIINIFDHKASSQELTAGVHENVRIVSIDTERRKDRITGALVKKQVFIKFKKFDENNNDIGEKNIFFFLVDPNRDSAIENLRTFITQIREILSVYYSEKELDEKFDPIRVLVEDEDSINESDFEYDNIKTKVIKNKSKNYTAVELEVARLFKELTDGKIGMDSKPVRIKLENSKDDEFVQLPRYERFIESMEVQKSESKLHNN